MTWSAGQAKIHDFNLAPSIKHQVFWLDIAMDNVALFVSRIKCVSNLCCIFSSQVLGHRSIDEQQASDRWPLHVFHDKIQQPTLLPRIVDLHNIRMIQSSDNLSFSDETCHVGGIFRQCTW